MNIEKLIAEMEMSKKQYPVFSQGADIWSDAIALVKKHGEPDCSDCSPCPDKTICPHAKFTPQQSDMCVCGHDITQHDNRNGCKHKCLFASCSCTKFTPQQPVYVSGGAPKDTPPSITRSSDDIIRKMEDAQAKTANSKLRFGPSDAVFNNTPNPELTYTMDSLKPQQEKSCANCETNTDACSQCVDKNRYQPKPPTLTPQQPVYVSGGAPKDTPPSVTRSSDDIIRKMEDAQAKTANSKLRFGPVEPQQEKPCDVCFGRGYVYLQGTVPSIQAQEEPPTEPCPKCNGMAENGHKYPPDVTMENVIQACEYIVHRELKAHQPKPPPLTAGDLLPLLRAIVNTLEHEDFIPNEFKKVVKELAKLEQKETNKKGE